MAELTMMDYINVEYEALDRILKTWNFEEATKLFEKKAHRVLILATGSSMNAALAAKYFIEESADTLVVIEEPFNYLHFGKVDSKVDLVLVISQSGTSTSTINAIEKIQTANLDTVILTSNIESPIVKTGAKVLDLAMGIETVGYVTKGYSVTVLTLYLLGLSLALRNQKMSASEIQNKMDELNAIISLIPETITKSVNYFEENTSTFQNFTRLACIGYGSNYGVAKEFETKFTETVRRPSSGFEVEAYMHGPYLEANANHLLFFIEDTSPIAERSKNLSEYMNRNVGATITITTKDFADKKSELALSAMRFDNMLIQLLTIIPIQVWSYKLATSLGIDLSVDPFPDFDTALESKI